MLSRLLRSVCVLSALICPLSSASADLAVVASIPPVHSLVAKVMDGISEPYLLLRNGGSPHDYTLRPSDARALDNADLVFLVSRNIETYLDAVVEAPAAEDRQVIELAEAKGVQHLPVRGGVIWKKGAAPIGGHSADEAAHAGHEHEHDADDPHVWLSPSNGEAFVAAIAEALSARDPANEARYRANAEAAIADIRALTRSIRALLDPVRDRPFLVFHDGYQYFENAFGLRSAGAISLTTVAPPSAGRLRLLRAQVEKGNIRCVFRDVQFSPRLAEVVAEGTGAKLGTLDPVGSNTEYGPGAYEATLLELAKGFYACLK